MRDSSKSALYIEANQEEINMTTQTATTQIDPVCGMQVDPSQAAGTSEHTGKTYYFCSRGCKTKFDKNPTEFAASQQANASRGGCCG